MKTLHVLTTAAGVLLAISGPSLAAPRTIHHSAGAPSAYARDQSDNAFSYSPNFLQQRGVPHYAPNGTSEWPFGPGFNMPYPDRPYGDPDSW